MHNSTLNLRWNRLAVFATLIAALSAPKHLAAGEFDRPAQPPGNDAQQDLIFFGPLQPVAIRLHLYVDGRPFRQVWREHARGRYESLDTNRNGQIEVAEANQARPSLAALAAGGLSPAGDAALARFVASRGGTASIADCLTWQESSNDGPFSVTESAAAALSDGALMALLDADHDLRLARTEVEAAIDVLRRRDFDNNEILTRNELISGAALYQSVATGDSDAEGSGTAGAAVQATDAGEVRSQFVHIIRPGSTSLIQAQAVLARYDHDGNRVLTASLNNREIAIPAETLAAADTNQDAALDVQELVQLLQREPQVELVFQFGRLTSDLPTAATSTANRSQDNSDSPDGPGEAPTSAAAESFRVRERSDGSYKLELPDARVDLRRDNRHPTKNRPQEFSFRGFDSDANGYLDAQEAVRVIGKAPLSLLDSDGNGMVVAKEFDEFLTREGDAAGARLVLALTSEGQNLFDQVDANLDGGLTPRELRTAAEQLVALDGNADGYLDGDELPQQVGLVLARGRLRLPTAADAAAMRRPRGAARVEEEVGPPWFRKMDRNRDGDLSPREFLGSAEVFARFDANHDGLIDADEALAP